MKKVILDDNDLAEGIRKGDLRSFTSFYEAYHRYLFHFSLKFLKSSVLAEEAVHDVFLKVWENRHTLNPDLSLKGYLIKICKNHILTLLQRANREQTLQREICRSLATEHNETEDAIFAADLEVQVEQIISQLPTQRQKIFRMYRFEEMNFDEIASQLAISKGTVKDHMLKANRFIRKYLPLHSDVPLLLLILLS
ncbi:RNA polymerase sigma-70 factor [Rhabdobacter roseus]|uniref:RNA polymerase sigma-70 factor (ECF subfamily) n=1 Tax=Rhabdobacter roseus TaxID=1655419 RepID=A0A840TQ85_9BACT|nr:RNA polymerase sigma-70 factor [Rhabdobacter roseus]MBB5285494.1 RNA polymerase sigma-70 factor (ECF subfamily) [Rhabdobacter roseus]